MELLNIAAADKIFFIYDYNNDYVDLILIESLTN